MIKQVIEHTKRPTLLVMAGGTGGHIFPGIAVAQQLERCGWHIHWLGTAERMEADIIPKQGYAISFINMSGIRNKGWKSFFKAPINILISIWQAINIIKQVQPDVVIGMGGYASAPGGIGAKLLGKPLILHEQNAVAGMTNRLLARIANKTLSAFPNAFSKKIKAQVVGNPLRNSILALNNKEYVIADDSINILIVGGSLGAKILNDVVPETMANFREKIVNVWHQTGANNHKEVIDRYQENSTITGELKVTEFIDDMADAYQWANIVICRAGALTVSEIAMVAKPAIFVPLPHAVDDHQTKNAMYLVACGAAKCIAQQEFTMIKLLDVLNLLCMDKSVIMQMSKAASKAAHVNATRDVVYACKELAKI